MNRKNLLLTGVGALALLLCLTGVNWFSDLRSFKEDEIPDPNKSQEQASQVVEDQVGIVDQQQGQEDGQEQPGDTGNNVAGETVEVSLYFSSLDNKTLVAEKRQIPKEEGIARATMEQLIAGPREEDLSATLPGGAQLLDINIRDGLCTVDFSGELTDGLPSSDSQAQALRSIVNTLCQFDSVQKVQILIDGRQIGAIGGIDASQALTPQ